MAATLVVIVVAAFAGLAAAFQVDCNCILKRSLTIALVTLSTGEIRDSLCQLS